MSVTFPQGFRAAGVAAGLKASGAPDLALIVNDGPRHDAAAVFTTNRIQAAPVVWSRQVVADHRVDAVVLNSGGANACTGARGLQDAHASAEKVADVLGISAGDVAVCSTGLIGELLPMDRVLAGIDAAAAALSATGGDDAAEAIRTTDTVAKTSEYAATGWGIGGIAKGAGMLAPGLATMLVVLTTDALIEPDRLDALLRRAVSLTFDRIDSDGCMSTNDTVILLSSGASGITVPDQAFERALIEVCAELAIKLIKDAEGAAHDIRIDVRGAASEPDAVDVARAIARNNLVKCAIFGGDANWGRILAAIGTTSAVFDPAAIDVAINDVTVCRSGGVGDDRSLVDLSDRQVRIQIDLGAGDEGGVLWTNDLTHQYVHENSAYST